MVRRTSDSKLLFHSDSPTGKWASGSHEQNTTQNTEEEARPEYVLKVFWAYRTTTSTPIGATPFSLTYGSEAVIPAEVGSPSFQVSHYNPGLNDEGIKLNLDLLQERRDEAQVTWAAYQGRAARYFNKTVNPRKFRLGDWVLRKVSPITKYPTEGKLGPQREGPYKVIRCHDKGAYHLIDTTGRELPRAWNAKHLNKYFI
jgi:hypothetical protein